MKNPQLSAYTIAKNCTDLADVRVGLQELEDYFIACDKVGQKPSSHAYIRFAKLSIKQDKLNNEHYGKR